MPLLYHKTTYMQTKKFLLIIIISISLFGCGGGSSRQQLNMSISDSAGIQKISSSAAVENTKDTIHNFIRTADIKFKVKNVIPATYTIEDIVNQQGGFVTYTNLASTVDNITSVPISADTTLETTYFTVTNNMTIRLPNTKFDTTLKSIATLVDFLDSRVIKADDVSLQILTNNLSQRRIGKSTTRLTNDIDSRGKKLTETTNAEETLSDKEEQADNAFISNRSLIDQIKFSTITLSIYQRQSVKRELIANDKNIDAYKPGLGSQLVDSLQYGWEMLKTLIVCIVRFWGLLLLGVAGYVVYKTYKFEHKNKQ
jgi:hypothetical protein